MPKWAALESAANAIKRLQRVQAAHARRVGDPECYPMRLAVVIELPDLPIAGDHDVDSEEGWAEVEHLESALRFVLAGRLGRVARWTDWIHVDRDLDDAGWVREVKTAWEEITALGRTASDQERLANESAATSHGPDGRMASPRNRGT